MTDNIQIVLVQPEDNANIGAVARAMKNRGFSNLHLAAAQRFDFERAKITACNAEDLLLKAHLHESLDIALAQMQDVIGFSARSGKNRPSILLSEWLKDFCANPIRKTALLFGPEETGLHEEHVKHCRWLVRIPTNPDCPSLNLAQAVLIVLYELSKLGLAFQFPRCDTAPVPWKEFQHFDALLNESLLKSGFYNEGTAPHMPQLVSNLFRRILPNEREMKILQGIFSRFLKGLPDSPQSSGHPLQEKNPTEIRGKE